MIRTIHVHPGMRYSDVREAVMRAVVPALALSFSGAVSPEFDLARLERLHQECAVAGKTVIVLGGTPRLRGYAAGAGFSCATSLEDWLAGAQPEPAAPARWDELGLGPLGVVSARTGVYDGGTHTDDDTLADWEPEAPAHIQDLIESRPVRVVSRRPSIPLAARQESADEDALDAIRRASEVYEEGVTTRILSTAGLTSTTSLH